MELSILLVACAALNVAGCGGFLHPAAERAIRLRAKVVDVPDTSTCHWKLLKQSGIVIRAREDPVALVPKGPDCVSSKRTRLRSVP